MEVGTKRKRRPSAKDGAQEHSPVLKKLKEVQKEATKEIKCPDCGGLHSDIWNLRQYQLEVSFSYTTHHLLKTFGWSRAGEVTLSGSPRRDPGA
jgi:hypothetical protein